MLFILLSQMPSGFRICYSEHGGAASPLFLQQLPFPQAGIFFLDNLWQALSLYLVCCIILVVEKHCIILHVNGHLQ